MEVNVLMIDDHPPIIEGYKIILTYNPFGYIINASSAYSCEMAYEVITTRQKAFDIVFLDLTLPSFVEQKINDGLDLIPLIRKHFPLAKILILTSHIEALVLLKILKDYQPDGLLVKNDILNTEFLNAFDAIIKGTNYYSETVKNVITDSKKTIKSLDNYNIQILMLLSRGVKTKTIQEELHLSKSAIDKRKIAIKHFLDIEKGNDEDILKEARKQGLI